PLTLPSCKSEMEQASMKACAITDRQASIWSVLSMSNTNCGFFKMFTQKRSGKLERKGGQGRERHKNYKLPQCVNTVCMCDRVCVCVCVCGCMFRPRALSPLEPLTMVGVEIQREEASAH